MVSRTRYPCDCVQCFEAEEDGSHKLQTARVRTKHLARFGQTRLTTERPAQASLPDIEQHFQPLESPSSTTPFPPAHSASSSSTFASRQAKSSSPPDPTSVAFSRERAAARRAVLASTLLAEATRKVADNSKRLEDKEVAEEQAGNTRRIFAEQEQPSVTSVQIILFVVAFLHCCLHLGRASTNTILRILRTTVPAHLPSSAAPTLLNATIPADITTVIKILDIDPVLVRTLCCPTCFTQYPLDTVLERCIQRVSARARVCNALLHRPNGRPLRVYTTQSLHAWLQRLVQRSEIEPSLLPSWFHEEMQGIGAANIWQSQLWHTVQEDDGRIFLHGPGNLAFSLFVDWFNPEGNKIAGSYPELPIFYRSGSLSLGNIGKHTSIGSIVLFLLNLPPSLRYQPANVFVAGVIPGPREPSVLQINNVLRPLTAELSQLWHTGVSLRTPSSPDGRLFRGALIALITDLVAARKVGGFGSHAAGFFCSMCTLHRSQMTSLEVDIWARRDSQHHAALARAWRDATSMKERESIFKSSGVRWSALNSLPYWDPPKMVLIDTMHNVAGILDCHCRRVLGIDEKVLSKGEVILSSGLEKVALVDGEGSRTDDDAEQYVEELEGEGGLQGSYLRDNAAFYEVSGVTEGAVVTTVDAQTAELQEDEAMHLDNPPPPPPTALKNSLTKAEVSLVRLSIAQTQSPTWMDRPPSNLGEPSHGKLKSSVWIILFRYFLPLAMISMPSPSLPRLQNLFHLVAAIRMIGQRTWSSTSSTELRQNILSYLSTLRTLFPDAPFLPNHHFCLHLPEMGDFVGPLAEIAAWSGERMNAQLAKVPTNHQLWDTDLTMLRQTARSANLFALASSMAAVLPPFLMKLQPLLLSLGKSANQAGLDAQRLLRPRSATSDPTHAPPSTAHRLTRLPPHIYNLLIRLLHEVSPLRWQHSDEFPLSPSIPVLSPWHQSRSSLHRASSITAAPSAGLLSTANSNSVIVFHDPLLDSRSCGVIVAIFEHTRDHSGISTTESFVVLHRFGTLTPEDAAKSPFHALPDIGGTLFYELDIPESRLCRAADLREQVVVCGYKEGTFGIESKTVGVIIAEELLQ